MYENTTRVIQRCLEVRRRVSREYVKKCITWIQLIPEMGHVTIRSTYRNAN